MEESHGHAAPVRRVPRWVKIWVPIVVLLLVALGLIIATRADAFDRHINGKVACANGEVTGVSIEAKRFPRIPGTGIEVSSGFAGWWAGPQLGSAQFEYRLPYSGEYSIHFGCGMLGEKGSWASDNRTPFIDDANPSWKCYNPVKPTGLSTVVVTDCRSVS